MALDIRKTITDFFTKSQKAQYAVANSQTSKNEGQPAPSRYDPETRIALYKTPIVFASINAIADQVAKVQWEIVPKKSVLDALGYGSREEGKGAAVLTRKDWMRVQKYVGQDRQEISSETKKHIQTVYSLFDNPNENAEDFASILKKIAIDLKVHDAAAIEKTKNGMGEVVELYTAPAPYIRMNFDKNGKLLEPAYKQVDPKFNKNVVAEWNGDELIYMMLNPISTSMYGVSPLDVIAEIVATLINAMNYNGTYFESAALPEGYFTIPNLSETAARRLMIKWEQEIKSKAHKVLFMPAETKWNQFRFTNSEMQWLEGQKFYMEIVMAVLGTSKEDLGLGNSSTGDSAIHQSVVVKNKSIIPILNKFSQKINQEVVGNLGFGYDDVMFIFKNVDLADKATMDEIHEKAVKSGRMTINETREEAGKPPYENFGDEPVIATSQGLVFLKQYHMQFSEYQQEFDALEKESKSSGKPIAQLRREQLMETANVGGENDKKPQKPNSPDNPKKPPRAPKSDQKSVVDETELAEESFAAIAGLEKLTERIEKIIGEEDEKKHTQKSKKRDRQISSEPVKSKEEK